MARKIRTEDPDFRDSIAAIREHMTQRGVAEEGLNWEEIERKSRLRYWARRIRDLGGDVSAAVEVVFDEARQAGRVLNSLAETVPAKFNFSYAPPPEKLEYTLGMRGAVEAPRDVVRVEGVNLRGASITVDATKGTIAVRLVRIGKPTKVVLLDADGAEVQRRDAETDEIRFEGITPGEYALAIFGAVTEVE